MSTACHVVHRQADLFDPNVVKVVLDTQRLCTLLQPRDDSLGARCLRHGSDPHPGRAARLPPHRHLRLPLRLPRAVLAPGTAAIERFEALEQLRALWHGYRITVAVTDQAPEAGVDTPEDLETVRRLFASDA